MPILIPNVPMVTSVMNEIAISTPGSNENSSSALDQAMAATLASIEVPELPQGNNSLF